MAEKLSPISSKGDLIAGDASGNADKLSVGTDGQVLMANSAAALGMVWSTPSGGASVTSQEVSVAVAVETSNRISAVNALSTAISAVNYELVGQALDGPNLMKRQGNVIGDIFVRSSFSDLSGIVDDTAGRLVSVSAGNIMITGSTISVGTYGASPSLLFGDYTNLDVLTVECKFSFPNSNAAANNEYGMNLAVFGGTGGYSIGGFMYGAFDSNLGFLRIIGGDQYFSTTWVEGIGVDIVPNISVNDVIHYKLELYENTVTWSVRNVTDDSAWVVQRYTFTGTQTKHGTGKVALLPGVTNVNIHSLTINSKQIEYPDLYLYGDSKFTKGTTQAESLPALLKNNFGVVVANTGVGDTTGNLVLAIDEVKYKVRPKKILIEASNDIRYAVAASVWQNNLSILNADLTSAGIDVYFAAFQEGPTGANQSAMDAHLASAFPTKYIRRTYEATASCKGCLLSDDIHLAAFGNQTVYNTLVLDGRLDKASVAALTSIVLNSIADVSTNGATDGQVLIYNSAAGQWVASTMAAGVGSVTSTELSAVSAAAASGIATVSNAVSALSAQLSLQISAMSQAHSVLSVQVASVQSALSALSNQNSVDHASIRNLVSIVSNATSVVSAAQAATSADLTSVKSALSALSQANSAAHVSINNAISVVSNAVSIVSAAQAVTSADLTSLKNVVSNLSVQLSLQVSALSQALSAKTISSLAGTSIGGATDGQALVYNSVDGKWHASTLATGANISSLGGVSVTGATDQQVLVYNSADGKWHASTVAGGTASVTSAEYASTVSIVSLLLYPPVESVTSADYTLSAGDNGKIKYFTNSTSAIFVNIPTGLPVGFETVIFRASGSMSLTVSAQTSVNFESQGTVLGDPKTAAQIIHKLSDNYIGIGAFLSTGNTLSVTSVEVNAGGGTYNVVQNAQGISATTLASANSKISGLSATLSSNAVYQLQAILLYSVSAANVYRFALSNTNTTYTHAGGIWDGAISIQNNQVSGNSVVQRGTWNQAGFGSVTFSAAVGTGGLVYPIKLDGLLVTSTTGGTIQLKALTSAGTNSPITILKGSFIRVFKLA